MQIQQGSFDSVLASQDATLARGESVTYGKFPTAKRAMFVHNPSCQGQYACRCDGRGKGGIRMVQPKRGATATPDTREAAEVLPRPRQAPVNMDADTIASLGLSHARAQRRAALARHVEAWRA